MTIFIVMVNFGDFKMSNVKKYLIGNVSLTRWTNENNKHSFTMEKSYLKDNNWEKTKSFSLQDLIVLRELINKAIEVKEL